jgi:hypothetical protein
MHVFSRCKGGGPIGFASKPALQNRVRPQTHRFCWFGVYDGGRRHKVIAWPSTLVGAGLLANSLVQALQGRMSDRVRQQAGSYRIGFARKLADAAGLAVTKAVVAIR